MASSTLTLILGLALAAGAGDAQKDAAGRPSTASTAVHKLYRRLLIDPKSPWNLYVWNTDLGG